MVTPSVRACALPAPRGELKDLFFFVYNDGKLKIAIVKIPAKLEVMIKPFQLPSGSCRAAGEAEGVHSFSIISCKAKNNKRKFDTKAIFPLLSFPADGIKNPGL